MVPSGSNIYVRRREPPKKRSLADLRAMTGKPTLQGTAVDPNRE
jgi:hypothetical protein